MGTLQFILIAAAVLGTGISSPPCPTLQWYHFKKPRKLSLLQILERLVGIQGTEGIDESESQSNEPARTYSEARNRMQRREKARLDRISGGDDPL